MSKILFVLYFDFINFDRTAHTNSGRFCGLIIRSTPSPLSDTASLCLLQYHTIAKSWTIRNPTDTRALSSFPVFQSTTPSFESSGAEENERIVNGTSTDPVNFGEQRKDGICEAAVSCRRYAISRTRSSRKRVRG